MVIVNLNPKEKQIWDLLEALPDPEIPVISIIDLGIVRKVNLSNDSLFIEITPTYSGCPAMKQIEDDIRSILVSNGFPNPTIKMVYEPAWTTDWINDKAKERLRAYGIAPPEYSTVDKSALTGKPKNLKCPRCLSADVKMISQFGSTACKALYQCNTCLEPFDYFKCI
jgi:ring-1,2-phenylacetyl-CoA epoxidase subunit PaaD